MGNSESSKMHAQKKAYQWEVGKNYSVLLDKTKFLLRLARKDKN